jgi:hypothetical protein
MTDRYGITIDEMRKWLDEKDKEGYRVIRTKVILKLLQKIDTNVQQPQQENQVGNSGERNALQLDELSDVERQEAGYPATREELLDALRSVRLMVMLGEWDRLHGASVRIRDILSREES